MEKFIRYSFMVLGCWFLAVGCKTTQKVSGPYPEQNFKVSFYSRGTGIDRPAQNFLDNLINKYTKDGASLPHMKTYLGKEGEVDYCFRLQDWDPEIFKKFFEELNAGLKDKQVYITKNVECNMSTY
jgi:hypothetical protein